MNHTTESKPSKPPERVPEGLDGRTVSRLMLTAFGALWLHCVHVKCRESGGCQQCWQDIRELAKQPDCDGFAVAVAVLALPDRSADTFADGAGLRWAETHAAEIADIGAAVDSAIREFGAELLDSALIAVRRRAMGLADDRARSESAQPESASGSQSQPQPRQAKTVRWGASPHGNSNRKRPRRKRKRSGRGA